MTRTYRRSIRGDTAASTSPIGPRNEHSANQKQPPRPFDVAIHAPRIPHTNQTGTPYQCFSTRQP